jgi:hypothetical protein
MRFNGIALTTVTALALLAPAPAFAAWEEVDAEIFLPGQINPCTGLTTDVTLSISRVRVSGEASGTIGLALDGSYTATDGSAGRFHDSDRGNVTASGGGFIYSYRAHYAGWYEGRRQHSTYVLTVHERDGEEWVTAQQETARCAGP